MKVFIIISLIFLSGCCECTKETNLAYNYHCNRKKGAKISINDGEEIVTYRNISCPDLEYYLSRGEIK